jgi:hypothetical protein
MIISVINQTQNASNDLVSLITIVGHNKWWIIAVFVLAYLLWSMDSILSVIADFISRLRKNPEGENVQVSGRNACFQSKDGSEIDVEYELIDDGNSEGRRGAEDKSDLQ